MSIDTALLRSVVADAVQTLLDFASGPLFSEKFALAFETPAPVWLCRRCSPLRPYKEGEFMAA